MPEEYYTIAVIQDGVTRWVTPDGLLMSRRESAYQYNNRAMLWDSIQLIMAQVPGATIMIETHESTPSVPADPERTVI